MGMGRKEQEIERIIGNFIKSVHKTLISHQSKRKTFSRCIHLHETFIHWTHCKHVTHVAAFLANCAIPLNPTPAINKPSHAPGCSQSHTSMPAVLLSAVFPGNFTPHSEHWQDKGNGFKSKKGRFRCHINLASEPVIGMLELLLHTGKVSPV